MNGCALGRTPRRGGWIRARCRRDVRSLLWGTAAITLIAAVGLTLIMPPTPRLIWNASGSAPIGVYAVDARSRVGRGAMVIARLPPRWRAFAARRNYVPAHVPLVKRVAATAGDRVCADGPALFVNGKYAAQRLVRDSTGKVMPWWSGCVTVPRGNFLLLMDRPGSFDSRYFGLMRETDMLGIAIPLWTH